MGLVAQHGGGARKYVLPDQILPDDADDHTGRADVLLHAAVDHAVLGHVHRLGQKTAGHVGHQVFPLGVGQLPELGAVDGIVLADVDIVRVLADGKIGAVGDVGEGLVRGGSHSVGLTEELGLLPGFLRPLAGDDVVRHLVLHEVHGNHGKLLGRAALHEQHLVIVGNAHQGAQVSLGLVNDGLVGLGAVAHFHDGHTGSPVIQHFIGGFPENLLRQHRRAGGKIINSGHNRPSLFSPYLFKSLSSST